MDDFFRILQFLRITAWAYDGALAEATVRAARHRRYPRGFDPPGDVRSAIAIGRYAQNQMTRMCMRMGPSKWLVKADGTFEPIV